MSKKIKGYFISRWDDGSQIQTIATLNPATGEVRARYSSACPSGSLVGETFEVEGSGESFEICPDCHEYIMKTEMQEGVGKQLEEVLVCSNPDCDSHE